jgi:hypothetical protein
VQFEVDSLEPGGMLCYCNICRKISGNPVSAILRAKPEAFRITHGKELISDYASTSYFTRHHCKVCHSHIYGDGPGIPFVFLRPGLFPPDAFKNLRFMHMFVADKVAWHEIRDHEKQFPGLPG